MAVIRDGNLDTTSDDIIFIATIGSLICLIVAVLGIKLRWFKHRMTFNELPTTSSTPTSASNGMEPQIIRATFKPSSDFDNYVEITPPKVLPPVRIHKSARNAISLPPRKRQAPEIPTLRVSETNDTQEIEPLQTDASTAQVADNLLLVDERRTSTPPPPLPHSPPPNDHEERLLLALEADYPYTESETIKIKEVQNNESILPSPPPYQESDPLAHIHFKKFTKKKHSSTPVPSTGTATSLEDLRNDSPILRKSSVELSPSPREIKLSKRHSFLNQVETPTEIPKLAFDFPSVSTPNLSGGLESNQPPLVKKDLPKSPKSNEKKSFLEYFGFKTGSKVENDDEKTKIEKKVVPTVISEKKIENVAPKTEKKPEAAVAKTEKKVEVVASKSEKKTVSNAPIAKQKVKKIRVLKSDKKETVRKGEAVKNERLAIVDPRINNVMESTMDNRSEDKNALVAAQHTDQLSDEVVLPNRIEIDYFQKVKKPKSNRVPIIVKSPKPEPKFDDKPPKTEVFRHEETFSAANGPLKVKKKKIKTATQDAPVSNGIKSVEIINNGNNPTITSSTQLSDAAPIPKPRAILKLDGFDDDNRDKEMKPKKKVALPPALSSPSSPSDTEDAWNLVAKHRLNTRAITATAISVRQKSESDDAVGQPLTLQTKQLEMLNKPKTMREMKREQEQRQDKIFNFGGKDDKESDTEA